MEQKDSSQTNPSSDKIYAVYTAPDYGSGGVLKNISTETFCGIPCIKGVCVQKNWVEGNIIRLPVQQVCVIIEFDTLEDYRKGAQHGGKLFFWR